MQSNEKNGRDFYALAWRWHFYAGLFVAPFMILLALTGIVYLFKPQLDALLYPQLLRVEAGAQMRSADQLLVGVRQAHPQAAVSQYLPPSEAGRSAQFVIGEEGRQWNLFVDPYSGRELGRQDAQLNLQAVARALHGELMVGTVGDRLIELAAGWGIVPAGLRSLPMVAARAGGERAVLAAPAPARTTAVARATCGRRFLGQPAVAVHAAQRDDLDRLLGQAVRRCLEPFPGGDVERCADLRHAGR